ncbi:MAG: NUDIX hydrolase [Ruminococcus sp.]|nr:NUDIX hydrolase [Ruminococcus sp.]
MNDYKDYERPSVAADVAAFGIDSEKSDNKRELDDKQLKILLVKRGEEPFKGLYSLPGGFLRPNETIESAALRELKEETGLAEAKLIPLKTYSDPERDPRGWVISCAFAALTRTIELDTEETSDAESSCWLTVEMRSSVILIDDGAIVIKLKNGRALSEELAFDHAQIIYDAFLKLRDEVKNHDIIFDLLPEYFTIADLQKPYEIITGKKEAAANFRRKMSKKIEETELFDNGGAMHRPSKLYKRRSDEE